MGWRMGGEVGGGVGGGGEGGGGEGGGEGGKKKFFLVYDSATYNILHTSCIYRYYGKQYRGRDRRYILHIQFTIPVYTGYLYNTI